MQESKDFDDYSAAGHYTINEPGANSESQSNNMYFDGMTVTDSDNNYMRINTCNNMGSEDLQEPVFQQVAAR